MNRKTKRIITIALLTALTLVTPSPYFILPPLAGMYFLGRWQGLEKGRSEKR
jgi:hypothetical protein